jgi:hypothetical protein
MYCGGPDGGAGAGELRAGVEARGAEVEEVDGAVAGEAHVLRLHVAVHDAGAVARGQHVEERAGQPFGLRLGEGAVALDALVEVFAFDERLDERRVAGPGHNVVERHDARVLELVQGV